MKTDEYLKQILDQESLTNESDEIKAIWKERENVEKILTSHFSESNPTIRYGGSKAKDTMIRSSYDLDIACYFDRDDTKAGETLEEIYNNVQKALESEYLVVRKTSALRLESKSGNTKGIYFHIDVVPGRFIEEGTKCNDVFIHQTTGDKTRLKTNLQTHIEFIRDSGCRDAIKLVKFWKKRNGLQIRTFILELLTVEVLKNCDKTNLESCLKEFWTKMKDEIDDIKVYDPANESGNDLSLFFDAGIKAMISSVATSTLSFVENDQWESIFGQTEELDKGAKVAAVSVIKSQNPEFRPYSSD